ncbi:AIG2-like family-domain-containing protein [Suillus subaureus]|uniref:Putative gamma-glutamylcyclotransferase n=1 Tax=Suillus subaureus TaxID=48587 RepID=A0A9P7DXY7_9AGAM|nr:AIG2-like family-domain-containing protein [Suillus subaureus]KAG1805989.1 AIG2-like family-domain-containing protein [Suillus subaureus]
MDAATSTNSPVAPIFVYGTLMAAPLLAWAIKGDSSKAGDVLSQRKPGTITGFERRRVYRRDYPALIRGNDNCTVDGYVIFPASLSEWKKLDNYEGSSYERTPVVVDMLDGSKLDAFAYVWKGGTDALAEEDWDFEYFETERLDAWLKRFGGMVLIG